MATVRELVTQLRYQVQEGELRRYVDGVKVAQRAGQEMGRRVRESARDMGGAATVAQRLGSRLQRMAVDARRFGVELRDGVRGGIREMDKLMAKRAGASGSLLGVAGAVVATGAAIAQPVRNAARFERENQLIGNTANLDPGQVKALGAAILQASKETNQGADDIQRGIGFLVAAGLDVERAKQQIVALGRTSTAAGADIEDLAKASYTLGDSLKIPAAEMQDALDILATAGKAGNVELRDMAGILPTLGPAFAALKMQGREATASLAAMLEVARKGAPTADEAANNMQNFLSKVLAPDTLKKAQKNFGVDLYSIVTKAQKTGANPIEAAIAAISKATGGDQKKLGEMFQDMQVQNFLRPMMQSWDEYLKIKNEALTSSAGTTDRDFAKMMATRAEQFKWLANAADRLSKSVGAALFPDGGGTLAKLTALIEQLRSFVETHPQAVAAAGRIAAALVGMRVALFALSRIVGPFWTFLRFLMRWRAAGFVTAFARLGSTGLYLLRIWRWLGVAMAAIGAIGLGPLVVITAAIVAAALAVRKYWEPINAFFGGFWAGFAEAGGQALGELQEALAPLGPSLQLIGGLLGELWDWFVELIAPVDASATELEKAAAVGKVFGEAMVGNLRLVIATVGLLVKGFVWLGESIDTVAAMIVTNVQAMADAIQRAVPDWMLTGVGLAVFGPGAMAGKAANWMGIGAGDATKAGARGGQTTNMTAAVTVNTKSDSPAAVGTAAKAGTQQALTGAARRPPSVTSVEVAP
jgi:TP901 family phage tail tape measure protein